MEDTPAETLANASNDVQEAEIENQNTEETVADVSASEPQDQEMKTEESTKGTIHYILATLINESGLLSEIL